MTMRTTSHDPVVEQPTRRVDNPGVQTTDGTGPVRAPGQPTRPQNQRQSATQQVEAEVEDLEDQIGNFDGFTLPAPFPRGWN